MMVFQWPVEKLIEATNKWFFAFKSWAKCTSSFCCWLRLLTEMTPVYHYIYLSSGIMGLMDGWAISSISPGSSRDKDVQEMRTHLVFDRRARVIPLPVSVLSPRGLFIHNVLNQFTITIQCFHASSNGSSSIVDVCWHHSSLSVPLDHFLCKCIEAGTRCFINCYSSVVSWKHEPLEHKTSKHWLTWLALCMVSAEKDRIHIWDPLGLQENFDLILI